MSDPDDDPLERLSSKELHDLAVDHAKRHLDVGFFWELIELLPPAEAAAGEIDDAIADVSRLSAHIDDITDSGRGEVAEHLRPFYLEYLRREGVTPGAGEGAAADDLGPRIAWLALEEGTPVLDRSGRRIGVVEHVLADGAHDIFDGVILHTLPLPGRHLFADVEQIGDLRERGVVLEVDREQLHEPSERDARAAHDAERGTTHGSAESPLQARLRRAWDWISGR